MIFLSDNISKYKVWLIWAILNGFELGLPHIVFLHMHRAIKKMSGRLPRSALITKILREKGIAIPDELRTKKMETLCIGKNTSRKMNCKPTTVGWIDLKGEIVRVAEEDEDEVRTLLNQNERTVGDLSRKHE